MAALLRRPALLIQSPAVHGPEDSASRAASEGGRSLDGGIGGWIPRRLARGHPAEHPWRPFRGTRRKNMRWAASLEAPPPPPLAQRSIPAAWRSRSSSSEVVVLRGASLGLRDGPLHWVGPPWLLRPGQLPGPARWARSLGSLSGLAPWATGLPPPGLAPRRLPRRRPPRRPRWTERPLRPGSRAERPNRAIRAKAGPGCPKRASPRLWGRRRACLDTTHLHSQTTSGIAGLGVPPSVRSRPSEGLLGRSSATIPHTARPSLPTMGAARGLFSNRACRS